MEKIKDINKVKRGDFLNYHGVLYVVSSVAQDGDSYTIKLDNDITLVENITSRLEFFRTLDRIKLRTG